MQLLARGGHDARDVLPIIAQLLAGDDPARWLTGAQALGALSTAEGDKAPIVDMLYTAVRLPSPQVRTTSVQTLLMYGSASSRIVPLLAELLRDSEDGVRAEAVDGLGELSTNNPQAKEHLRVALADTNDEIRKLAAYWLEEDPEEEGD